VQDEHRDRRGCRRRRHHTRGEGAQQRAAGRGGRAGPRGGRVDAGDRGPPGCSGCRSGPVRRACLSRARGWRPCRGPRRRRRGATRRLGCVLRPQRLRRCSAGTGPLPFGPDGQQAAQDTAEQGGPRREGDHPPLGSRGDVNEDLGGGHRFPLLSTDLST
jgi:hypothetical protein